MNQSRSDTPKFAADRSPIDALNRTIEALEARLDGLVAGRSRKPAEPDTPLDTSRARPVMASENKATADAVSQIMQRQRRLDEERGRAPAPEPRAARPMAQPVPVRDEAAGNDSDLREVAAALVALRRELRTDLRQDFADGIAREFGALRAEIVEIKQAASHDSLSEGVRQDLSRLTDSVEQIGRAGAYPDASAVHKELEDLRLMIDGLAREDSVRGLDQRVGDVSQSLTALDPATILTELSQLTGRLNEVRSAIADMPAAFSTEALEGRVFALTDTVDRLVTGQDGGRMHDQFELVNDRLDEISRAIVASKAASLDPASIDRLGDRLEFRIENLADRLGDLAGQESVLQLGARVDAFSASMAEMVPANAFQELAAFLEDISARIEAIDAHVIDGAAGAALAARLDDLAARIDGLGTASTFAGSSDPVLLERFEALVERAEAHEPQSLHLPGLDALQMRLEDITARLDSSTAATPVSEDAFRSLEAQIANLSGLIAAPSSLAGVEGLARIEPRLAAIEGYLSHSQDDVIEAASRAAEAAVTAFLENGSADFDGSSDELSAVAGLAEDLRALEKLTRMSDDRHARTFDAVHDTLVKIADRLESLDNHRHVQTPGAMAAMYVADEPADDEIYGHQTRADATYDDVAFHDGGSADEVRSEPAERDETPAVSPSLAAAAAASAAMTASGTASAAEPRSLLARITKRVRPGRDDAGRTDPTVTTQDEAERPQLDATPSIDPSETLDIGGANEPLEPGSGTPDINRILQKVREQQAGGGRAAGTGYSETEKADFIAAARRAAQAAAAEVENTNRAQQGKKSSGRIGGGMGSRRKPILMAVGAVLLAIMSYPLVSALTSGQDAPSVAEREVAAVEAPVEQSTVVEEQVAEEQVVEQEQPAPEPETAAAPAAREPAVTIPATPAPIIANAPAVTEPASDPSEAAQPATDMQASTASVSDNISGDVADPIVAEAVQEQTVEPATAERRTAMVEALPEDIGPQALKQAAGDGNSLALFEIGARYTDGRGTQADLAQAAEWYRESAALGFAPAQYRLGNLYEKGTGIERDLGEALRWYGLAADQGNASAMHNLAVLHATGGRDTPPDYDKAGEWFSKAAELGVRDSQFNLAILHARGNGVAQDLGASYKWFAIAAREGDVDAASKRDEVANAMQPAELEAARAAVELWKPTPLNDAANLVDIPESWEDVQTNTASVDMTQAVRNIQTILNEKGFDAGAPDGIMGAKTVTAIRSFQTSAGMEPTGRVDDALVRALIEPRS